MNRERIEALKQALELQKNPMIGEEGAKEMLGFNMTSYWPENKNYAPDRTRHHCRTAACLAGWTVGLFGSKEDRRKMASSADKDWVPVKTLAAELLEVNTYVADMMFAPTSDHTRNGNIELYTDIQPRHAVKMLEGLLATGKVLWDFD